MAKKKSSPPEASAKTEELSGITGAGVAQLTIPEIDKAINKYERKKEARCNASPDEIAAKNELRVILHSHRDALHTNAEGNRFYRLDDLDYVLEEKLKRRKCDTGEDDED